MLDPDGRTLVTLAIGRLLRLGSRPFQPSDLEDYYRVRQIILDCAEDAVREDAPNWTRDRLKGAVGD